MPDVVGMELEVAKSLLNQLGFDKIRTRSVESDKPKDTVVYQSEKHNEEIDVTTEILLEISEGPEQTQPTTEPIQPPAAPPTQPPTEPPLVTLAVCFICCILRWTEGGKRLKLIECIPCAGSFTYVISLNSRAYNR